MSKSNISKVINNNKIEKVDKKEESFNPLKNFRIPQHNSNCKVCHGTGRIGYEVYIPSDHDNQPLKYKEKKPDRKNRKKGPIIECPVFKKEIDTALKSHIKREKEIFDKKKEIKIDKLEKNSVSSINEKI